ncbi:MAG: GNAT family N-acetyltransferase [Pseudomonadota bacterium]
MSDLSTLQVRQGVVRDAQACADILNAWIDETPWMPRVHSHQDVVRHYSELVLVKRHVLMACSSGGEVEGFAALDCDDSFVTALYVAADARNKGVGGQLLDATKKMMSQRVSLWTFIANHRARRFYAREGFFEVRRTNGDNEEKLPDVLLTWEGEKQ